jgi:hypothetical protein
LTNGRDVDARKRRLERRVRTLLIVVIVGLVLSGLTAFPIETELRLATRLMGLGPGPEGAPPGAGPERAPPVAGLNPVAAWLVTVRDAVIETNARYPFLAYGTDWLAFAHLMIAFAFLGALRDPVRNSWIVTFGLIASAGIFALAIFAGPVRGIPWFWTLVDCAFGVGCGIPLLVCRRDIRELESLDRSVGGLKSVEAAGEEIHLPRRGPSGHAAP